MPVPVPIVYDMETQDPDDFFTLCWLCGSPLVRLLGVTVRPGSNEQVGLAKFVLRESGHEDVPVGRGADVDRSKQYVSGWHFRFLGKNGFPPAEPDAFAWDVIGEAAKLLEVA